MENKQQKMHSSREPPTIQQPNEELKQQKQVKYVSTQNQQFQQQSNNANENSSQYYKPPNQIIQSQQTQGYQQQQQQQYQMQNQSSSIVQNAKYDLKLAAHPYTCIFTCIFKAAALFIYFFTGAIFPIVIIFISVLVFSALDFWVVKNITGRLLVGLRWWRALQPDGQEVWRFESHDGAFMVNLVDKTFFWTAQTASTIAWGVFLAIQCLSLSPLWAILTFLCFMLSGTNWYGFYQCSGDHQNKVQRMNQSLLANLAMDAKSEFRQAVIQDAQQNEKQSQIPNVKYNQE